MAHMIPAVRLECANVDAEESLGYYHAGLLLEIPIVVTLNLRHTNCVSKLRVSKGHFLFLCH